jgi:hypothetical protein
MANDLRDILDGAAVSDEVRARFGAFLGLEAAVPSAIVRRAQKDRQFVFHLVNCRNRPHLLKWLLADPRNAAYEASDDPTIRETNGAGANGHGEQPAAAADVPDASVEQSSAALAAKAMAAMTRWASTGFAAIKPEVFERRWRACQSCDRLRDPPDRAIYRLKFSSASDPRVCQACGCAAQRKARMPTQSCPLPDPANSHLTRWGEPIVRPANSGG